jgi:hypothetical protein
VHFPEEKTREDLAYLRKEVKRLRAAINRLTPGLSALLRRRGFTIYKKEPPDDLLVPAKKYQTRYYQMLHKYSFRLFLRDVIKHQRPFTPEQVTRYATPGVTKKYLDYLLSVKLLDKKTRGTVAVKRPVKSFGATLEWYAAQVFSREFGSEAVWGVKFRRTKVGGDYDVITKFDGSLCYLEVKSSPPKQIYDSEIAAFLDRVEDLAPELSVFLMDTELRMKDKIVPMFEAELAHRSPYPPAVIRMERELFTIQDRIFIINAKEDIVRNLQKALSWHYRHG